MMSKSFNVQEFSKDKKQGVSHLLVKLEHKALCVLKKLNLIWKDKINLMLDQLNEMDKFHHWTYERSNLYKERIKLYHDKKIEKREF